MENVLKSETVFRCPIFSVEHAIVELPNGSNEDRWYVVKNDAVGIIAMDEQNRIILTQEYRSASRTVEWRIPAGSVESGEIPEMAAHREMREETGLDARNMELLIVRKYPSGWVKQSSFFFLADTLFSSPLSSGEFESIKVIPTEVKEVLKKIESGDITGNLAEALKAAVKKMEDRNLRF
jgi:mutator protein MutT